MWKNVFIESCILSALIFGGFYLNANILKKEISVTQDNFRNESQGKLAITHISGNAAPPPEKKKPEKKKKTKAHLSGNDTSVPLTPVSPISGTDQPPLRKPK